MLLCITKFKAITSINMLNNQYILVFKITHINNKLIGSSSAQLHDNVSLDHVQIMSTVIAKSCR